METRLTAVDTVDENAINIYCDGSSYAGPRRGGIGILYVTVGSDGREVPEALDSPGYEGATNNEMELQAYIRALDELLRGHTRVHLEDFEKVILKTDSMYVAENFRNAIYVWPTTGWMTKAGTPVINARLWKQLVDKSFKIGRRFRIEWVKGIAGTRAVSTILGPRPALPRTVLGRVNDHRGEQSPPWS
jgi:ribonuclease HI